MTLPLEGIRVLDLSRLGPGPWCSMLLADFGADVVKVEDTGAGDYARWMAPLHEEAPASVQSATFLGLNRNKRSIRIDLKQDAGRDTFHRLVGSADVVLEGNRPGVADRLGVGYEALREINPRIVFCAITGYGQYGPNVQRSGHDINYLALAGAMDLTGELDGPPIPPAVQVADLAGGSLHAAFGILLALKERERSGEGQLVDASMFDGVMSMMIAHAAEYWATRQVPERGRPMLTGGAACYLPYLVKDGWVTFGAIEPKFWENFCRGVEREDLIEHHDARTDEWAHGQLEQIFLRRTRAEWQAFADEHDCCLEPVLHVDEALDTELVKARGMVVEVDGRPALGPAIKLSRTPGDPHQRPVPVLGQHTAEVLSDAGFSADEIIELEAAGAVAGPPSD